MSIQSRSYCPRAGSLPASCIQYFANNRSATLTLDQISKKFDAAVSGMWSNLRQAVDAGFLQYEDGVYSAGDDIDDAPDYGKVAAADATIKAAATQPNAPHNVFGAAAKPPRAHTPHKKAALPDALGIQLDSGIPLPPSRCSAQQNWTFLLGRMSPGQSCALPNRAKSSLAKVVTIKNKTTSQKFAIRKISETEIRLWRTA